MDPIFSPIRDRARSIVSLYSPPQFYKNCARACAQSRDLFETDPIIIRLRKFVSKKLDDDFGHGIDHAIKVTLDAGALMIIESKGSGAIKETVTRYAVMAQCAGLLHDIKRKSKNHAHLGAEYAQEILQEYPLTNAEIDNIGHAIRTHEAFKPLTGKGSPEGGLLSACLYDADKFRWGPDNFTDTVWSMITFSGMSLSEFIRLYPDGMKKLEKIKTTFRTPTGKKFGPEFIDIGLTVGRELWNFIQTDIKKQ